MTKIPQDHSALKALSVVAAYVPSGFKILDGLREPWRINAHYHPACYLPIAAALAVLTQGGHAVCALYAGTYTALGTWRITKGIFRFDPDLYEALTRRPVESDVPPEVLERLPHWCVYVETPDGLGAGLAGFFVHLEADANTGARELRFVLDFGPESWEPSAWPGPLRGGLAIPLLLGKGGAAGSLKELVREAEESLALALPSGANAKPIAGLLGKMLALALYLCSSEEDVPRPERPAIKRVKGGERLFATEKAEVLHVGIRMGAKLRAAEEAWKAEAGAGLSTGRTVAPHWRRSHFHTYWVGRGEERRRELRWIFAFPVAHKDGVEAAAVIRPVEK